jgi:hypothetical protein
LEAKLGRERITFEIDDEEKLKLFDIVAKITLKDSKPKEIYADILDYVNELVARAYEAGRGRQR